jgi:iron complex outermembrane receptor protein
VPIAITAVNSAMLEQRGATNIADIGASAPNVTLRPAAASFGPSVVAYIRGVGQRDTNFALEPGSASILTMFICPRCMGRCSIWSIWIGWRSCAGRKAHWRDRIPSAGHQALFQKPDANPDAYISATYGAFNRVEIRGGANFTIAPDKLYMRLTGVGAQGRLCHPL